MASMLRVFVLGLLAASVYANAPSRWSAVPMAPPDPILGVAAAFKEDTNPKKVNLGIGAYRDHQGKPIVLRCVREAEQRIANDETLMKEYLPIQGLDAFLKATPKLIFGEESPAVSEDRIAVVQSLSGTGALRVAAEFIAMYNPGTEVYCSDPTWGNHHTIFQKAGLKTHKYRYLSPTMGLDIDGMLEDLKKAPKGSTFVLHTVAHNPTGVDPTPEQWEKIADVCAERDAVIVFDTAYQGYASGDLSKDAWALRYFANERGMEVMVTQSYSKNFGLYGERIGALNIMCKDKDTATKVQSQLKGIIRPMYSNPQLHGARLVSAVLADKRLRDLWEVELTEMSDRIIQARAMLVRALKDLECPPPNKDFQDWSHITSQIGMFAYTGLNEKQCAVLTEKHHIYCTKNGRFSMAGVNPGNVKYVAEAMKEAVTSS